MVRERGVDKSKHDTTLKRRRSYVFTFHVRGLTCELRQGREDIKWIGGVFGFNTLHVLLTFIYNKRIPSVLACIFIVHDTYLHHEKRCQRVIITGNK